MSFSTTETNPATTVPLKLVRSRAFRPKPVRPLNASITSGDTTASDREDQLLQDQLLTVANYHAVIKHKQKTILLHATDQQQLEEARDVLKAYYANKSSTDLML